MIYSSNEEDVIRLSVVYDKALAYKLKKITNQLDKKYNFTLPISVTNKIAFNSRNIPPAKKITFELTNSENIIR